MSTRLAQALIARGLLSEEQVAVGLRHASQQDGALDTALLEMGVIAEAELLELLGELSGVKAVNLADFEPNPEVAAFIPSKVAERLGAVPLSLDGTSLHVACLYPVAAQELQEVGFLLGKNLELWVGVEARVRQWISLLYGLPLTARYAHLLRALDSGEPLTPKPVPLQGSLVEEDTLEASLAREMVEKLAASVALEPIPLEVRKSPRQVELPASPETGPQFLVFPNPTPALEVAPPPPAAKAAPAAAVVEDIPEWTLEQARAAVKSATRDRQKLIDTVLRYGRRTFDYVAAFAVIRGSAVGWAARGEGLQGEALVQLAFPLDTASVFRTAATTRVSFAGPLPPDPLNLQFLGQLGRTPRMVFLHPIEVKGRMVALLYGDCGAKPFSQRRLADFVLLCQELPTSFRELILFRKQRLGELQGAAEAFDVEGDTSRSPMKGASLGWGLSSSTAGSAGRAASLPPRIQALSERPPPDFAPLLQKLVGPDAALRASAMAELARSPEASAKALASRFPGPTAWSRLPVVQRPEPHELGPIPAALARLGRQGAQALVPLMRSQDAEVRYYALLVAGALPFNEVLDGVVEGLFDVEPDISSAARVAITALRGVPRFEGALPTLRQALKNPDPLRSALAARALGTLRDREAIESLISLAGSNDALCAQAAADALHDITRATHGTAEAQWTDWWLRNKHLSRAQWLVNALRHSTLDVRLAALEELGPVLNDSLGFAPGGTPTEREAAVQRWERALGDPALTRRFSTL